MQEVFEKMVNDVVDIYEDAIQHTDVVKLVKDLKLQMAVAESRSKMLEHEINKPGVHYQDDDDLMEVEILELSGQVEAYKYVIDVIESGKFIQEDKNVR